MANKQVGEMSISACGKDYTIQFGTWALSEIEDKAGKPFGELLKELEGDEDGEGGTFSLKTAILFVWGGLQTHHEGATMKDAAGIIDALGLQGSADMLTNALVLAFPELGGTGVADNGTANPKGSRRQRRAAARKKS